MILRVRSFKAATEREWDTVWSRCEYATYFSSREWGELWQKYTKSENRPLSYLIKFSDNASAILPLMWYSPGQIYFSSPATTYGGLISLENISYDHLFLTIKFVKTYLGTVFARVNPFMGDVDLSATDLQFQDDKTQIIDLRSSFQDIISRWSRNHHAAVNRAQGNGVTVRVASSLEDWRHYFLMYESSLERWGDEGSSRFSRELFDKMYYLNSRNIKLWIAQHENRPIAGVLCFYSKKHAVYWHGAAFAEYFSLRPVQLIFYEAIRDAVDRGYYWFDFNPSGGHEGVKRFKKGFGTTEINCPWIEVEGEKQPEGWRGMIRKIWLRFGSR